MASEICLPATSTAKAEGAARSNWPHTAILLSESREVSRKKEGLNGLWCLALEDDVDKGGECRQQPWVTTLYGGSHHVFQVLGFQSIWSPSRTN